MLNVGFEPIPGYRLEKFLGRGQFGEVWRATSPGGTHVALKFLNVRERQGRKEFQAIQKVKGIRHPHLVLTYALWLLDESMRVIDDAAFDNNHSLLNDTFGATLHRMPIQQADKQKPFMLVIATVLCEQNLMERLKQFHQQGERGFPLDELIGYIEDAAKAIDFLNSPRHELGDGPVAIHHCDIKPENIMILGDLAVVGDFGVARILASGNDSRTTSMAGSVAYAAPETFDNRIEATSDQYSLAITYYELRTGKLPFPEESQAQVMRDKIAGNLDFREVSLEEAKVLQRAMSVSPSNRYPTARAFVEALRSTGGHRPQQTFFRSPFALLAFAGAIVFGIAMPAAWYLQLGPFHGVQNSKKSNEPMENGASVAGTAGEGEAKVPAESPGAEAIELVPKEGEPGQSQSTVDASPISPRKPIVVSITGNGTHDSIASAIADAKPGETIRIQPGAYRKSVVIPQSITLIGEGSEGDVRIASSTDACLTVREGSNVRIENVTLESKSSRSSAVDIERGKAELIGCKILASSLNSPYGLTVGSQGIATAENCKFECAAGKAVAADKGSSLTLRKCTFQFLGNTSSSLQRIAVHGNGANGSIHGCSFSGQCSIGIDWMESPNQILDVEDCVFRNCEIGIQARSCKQVSIRGTVGKVCEVFDAKWGINAIDSTVAISRIKVDGNHERSLVALRVVDRSNVDCKESEFVGHECGILARQSAITVDDISISSTRYAGMFVDASSVGGKALTLSKIAKYGLVAYSKGSSVKLDTLDIHALPNQRDKGIPIYAASGRIEFNRGEMKDFFCGILIDPKREIIGTELPDKRVLIELIGSLNSDVGPSEAGSSPVAVVAQQLSLSNCASTWVFNGAGSSHIQKLKCDLPSEKQLPVLAFGKMLERKGVDLTNFEVFEAQKTSK